MGPNTTHYASAQVLLLLGVGVVVILIILIVIDEGEIILIGEEIHSLILQKIIIIVEIGVGVSTKIFSVILPLLQLHVSLSWMVSSKDEIRWRRRAMMRSFLSS